jgi:predicted O-linked N-acetylglucosamine transferase (SPINDLY family)
MNNAISDCDAEPSRQAAEELLLRGDQDQARTMALALSQTEGQRASGVHLLGIIESLAGNLGLACALFRNALRQEPTRAGWWADLARVEFARRYWADSEAAWEKAVRLAQDRADFAVELARVRVLTRRYNAAIDEWKRAHSLGADPVECAVGIAEVYSAAGDHEAALDMLDAATEEQPDRADLQAFAADLADALWQHRLALEHRERAWRLTPGEPRYMEALSRALWNSGELTRSLKLSGELVASGKVSPEFHSLHLVALLHDPAQTAESLRRAHEEWARMHAPRHATEVRHTNPPDPERQLRVGWFGGDFYDTPTTHFAMPFFEHLDRGQFSMHVFDGRVRNDRAAAEFRTHVESWHPCACLNEEQTADLIRQQRIDVLIDTTGHFLGTHLGVFAYQPAPVQLSFPSYPATTGLDSLDGIITDRWVCPAGMESQYTEPAVRLPSGYLPWKPPVGAPENSLPASTNGFVTFGLFQRPVKMNAAVWDCVADAVNRVADSRLLIHNGFPQAGVQGSPMQALYLSELSTRGVDASRVRFRGVEPFATHLRVLASVDIALDSFPYNGQTTTCECLWMGVPVVTLRGDCHVARVAHDILMRTGFEEWSSSTREEYVATAAGLAADIPRLARLRAEMREQVARSPLVDGELAARELGVAIRALWRRWCGGRASTR